MKDTDLKTIIDITTTDYFRNPAISTAEYERTARGDNGLSSLMSLVNKPDRLIWLEFIKPYLTNSEFTALFKEAWVYVEFPSHSGVNKTTLIKWFKEADKSVLMTAEDFKKYSSLPDQVIAYRGAPTAHPVNSMSWTLSETTAKFFYNRYKLAYGDAVICKSIISKKWILAYFNDRNEKEIIVNPRQVMTAHRQALQGKRGNEILFYKPPES